MSKHSHNHENSPAAEGAGAPASGNETGDAKGNPAAGSGAENPAPETENAAPGTDLANWQLKSAELEAKLAELNDQFLRKAADFENFRKRVNREKQEITEFANLNLILDLLPVIDDFERAIKSAESSKDFASFYEGITMIEKRLSSQLESKWGLKRFDSEGQPFDPNRHEALQMEKSAGIAEPLVKEDYVKGYFLKEKVIRYAKVKVLMPENGGAGAGSAEGETSAPEAPSAG